MATEYMGERHHASKLTKEEVIYIRTLREEGLSYAKIARALDNKVSPFTVRDVVKGNTWPTNREEK